MAEKLGVRGGEINERKRDLEENEGNADRGGERGG